MEPLTGGSVADRLEAKGLKIRLDEAAILAGYVNLLEQWNRVHNLTGIRDREEFIDRHLVESLALRPFVAGPTVADVGSGGGLPGVPLAVLLPGVSFTLIESRRKRVSFLRHTAARLGLKNVTVAHARAEALSSEPFATVLARAVAPPAELLTVTRGLIAPGGRLVLLTGEDKGREMVALADGFTEIQADTAVRGLKSRIVVLELVPLS